MIKFLPLLIKAMPVVWAFIKEIILKRENKRYIIRNKLHLFVTIMLIFYTALAYVLFEGYNAHANASINKDKVIVNLNAKLLEKEKLIIELENKFCPLVNLEKIEELSNFHGGQKSQAVRLSDVH